MERLLFITILATGLIGLPLCADNVVAIADVPFSFYVGEKLMPPGQYKIGETFSSGNRVVITSSSTNESLAVQTNRCENTLPSNGTYLIFNKYPGDRYFLSQYHQPGTRTGAVLPKSRRERETVTSKLTAGVRATQVIILASIR